MRRRNAIHEPVFVNLNMPLSGPRGDPGRYPCRSALIRLLKEEAMNKRTALLTTALAALLAAALAGPASAALKVTWMKSVSAKGTPARYDKVGVIKVGPRSAQERAGARTGNLGRHRLLRPAGQMDRVEGDGLAGVVGRASREPARGPVGAEPLQAAARRSATQLYNYYLGCLKDPSDHPPLPAHPELDASRSRSSGA